jgi:hypothetical protein
MYRNVASLINTGRKRLARLVLKGCGHYNQKKCFLRCAQIPLFDTATVELASQRYAMLKMFNPCCTYIPFVNLNLQTLFSPLSTLYLSYTNKFHRTDQLAYYPTNTTTHPLRHGLLRHVQAQIQVLVHKPKNNTTNKTHPTTNKTNPKNNNSTTSYPKPIFECNYGPFNPAAPNSGGYVAGYDGHHAAGDGGGGGGGD